MIEILLFEMVQNLLQVVRIHSLAYFNQSKMNNMQIRRSDNTNNDRRIYDEFRACKNFLKKDDF